jgi:hypothetical protein
VSTSGDVTSPPDFEVRPAEAGDHDDLVALFRCKKFMAHLGGELSERGAELKFRGMVRRAKSVPYAEQPIILPDRGIVGYTGAGRFRFLPNEITELYGRYRDEGDDGEDDDFNGCQLELNCGLVDDATNGQLGPFASWRVLGEWNSSSERHLFARIKISNHPAKSLAGSLGFKWLKTLGEREFWRLKPGELREPKRKPTPTAPVQD